MGTGGLCVCVGGEGRGSGGRGVGVAKSYGVSFSGDENVLKLVVMVVAQLCDYTKNC